MTTALIKVSKSQTSAYFSFGYFHSAISAALSMFFMNFSLVQYPSFAPPSSSKVRDVLGKFGFCALATACSSSDSCRNPECWSTKSLIIMPKPFDFGCRTGMSSVAHIHFWPSLTLKMDSSWYINTSFFMYSALGGGIAAISSAQGGGGGGQMGILQRRNLLKILLSLFHNIFSLVSINIIMILFCAICA